ncbi:MAG TPA: hypothetical protein VMV83_03335 [Rectinemataceae bacterium]|nr:hypothetical protein [Rectinemataceae bacterium]
METVLPRPLLRLWRRALDAISFSAELRRLRRELNAFIDSPPAAAVDWRSHTLAASRWSPGRRVSIAEAYVRVVNDLDSRHARSRLRALKRIVGLSFHAKTLDMPLNTARVQLALIKDAIKNRGDRRRQLELLHDFSVSSFGQHQIIRRLLAERGMIELPENGLTLRDIEAGWDGNVHDSSTSGRKNATQLLIDAFIKGISELTIACGGPSALEQMEEAIEAGRIVGIAVRLGIEFSLTNCGRRFHFMAVLPPMERGSDVRRFFEGNKKALRELLSGLEENQEHRVEAIGHLLDYFNLNRRSALNEGFPKNKMYRVPKLRMRDLARFVPLSRVNRVHLGDFLVSVLEPIYRNRVLYLRVFRGRAAREATGGRIPEAEWKAVDERYRRARAAFASLNADELRRQLLSDPTTEDYQTVFDDLPRLRLLLREAGCRIRVVHPLEHGIDKALEFLEEAKLLIDEVEVFNIQVSAADKPEDLRALCEKVNALNKAAHAADYPPIVPLCGSDATGRSPEAPGMGFVFADMIGRRGEERYARRHRALPLPVAALVRGRGAPVDLDAADVPRLFSMGKVSPPHPRRLGDEEEDIIAPIDPRSALRYLNPALVDIAITLVGFLVARAVVGEGFALLWFAITGFRVAVADILASRGARFREWRLKSVNFDNVARALFWTGLSVPILGFVKVQFDQLWPFATSGLVHELARFFFISGANGLYIAAQNTIRGFDRGVIKANLFRSVFSWPFAAIFSPLGGAIGLPAIVQAKIWSDLVGGIIEGGAKYFKTLKLRRRDLEEIFPRLSSRERGERYTAILDLLWLWREEPRARDSLADMIVRDRPVASMAAIRNVGAGGGASPRPETAAGLSAPDPVEERDSLVDRLYRENLDRKLLDFIVEEYPRQVAVGLAILVADTLPEFRYWLSGKLRH